MRVWLLVVVAVAALAPPARAQERPNFAGLWEMNRAESDFGPLPAPDSVRYVIWHRGARLTFDHTQDGKTIRVEITIDGQERVTNKEHDSEVWTRAYWKEAELVLEARQRPRLGRDAVPLKWTSRWSLSADGNRLTIRRRITADDGQVEQSVVFDRAAPPRS